MRHHLALVAALLATSAILPCSAAAAPVLKVAVPAKADLTVAHVGFKGRTGPLRVVNRRLLGGALTVVGGVRKGLVTVVVVRRPSGSAGDSTVTLRLPKGRLKQRRIVRNVIANDGRPPYCRTLPPSFRHVRLLAGRALSGFSAASTAQFASYLGCRSFAREDAFLGALTGGASNEGGGEGEGGETGSPAPNLGGCEPGATDEACLPEEEDDGPPVSTTLRGTGTVTRTDDPRRFTYAISFNEPVSGYELKGVGTVHCPASVYADWYSTCPPDSANPPGTGLQCEQQPGSMVSDFQCFLERSRDRGSEGPTVPAGQTITGSYVTDPQVPPPSRSAVGLVGHRGATQGQETSIPVS